MNPEAQADPEEGGLDIDYDEAYGGIDVNDSAYQPSQSLKDRWNRFVKETDRYTQKAGREVGKEFTKETGYTAVGGLGDLLSMLGANNQQTLPGEKAVTNLEANASPEELVGLGSSDDDIMPRHSGLPTSQTARDLGAMVGLEGGEPETAPGKFAGRAGKLYGAGLPFGQINPIPALVGAAGGEAVEAVGGGPLLQTAGEIVGLITSHGAGQPLGSLNKDVQRKIDTLKALGYSEEDITLAIQAAKKNHKVAKVAKYTGKVEGIFENFADQSEKAIDKVLTSSFPGIEKGLPNLKQEAGNIYQGAVNTAQDLKVNDPRPFINAISKEAVKLKSTLASTPERDSMVNFLKEAGMKSFQAPTADYYIEFYKDLNKMGKWLDPKNRERVFTAVKDSIKETFRAQGKQGRELAKQFETANQQYARYFDAENVSELIGKATTQDGIDFKKFYKLFDKPENVELLQKGLGVKQTENLRAIAKTAKEVKDFDKAFGALDKSKIPLGAKIVTLFPAILAQDYSYLAGAIGTELTQRLASRMLTDTKFQGLLYKGMRGLRDGSGQITYSALNSIKDYLKEEEGIEID